MSILDSRHSQRPNRERRGFRGRLRPTTAALALAVACWTAWGFNFRNEPGKTCLDCHVEKKVLMEKRFAHGPFVGGACEDCHDPETISLRAEGAELCLGCHEPFQQALAGMPEKHQPLAWGECTACHEPHATAFRYSLRAPGADLCRGCHIDKKEQEEWPSQHPPFAAGDCGACHDPHAAKDKYLLTLPAGETCGDACHEYQPEELAASHQGFDVTKLECSSCHDPHASRRPSLVRENIHPPVARGLCEHCHTLEGDEIVLTFPEDSFCEGCHAGTLDREEAKQADHGPFRKRQCRSCHTPHGSQVPGMLVDRQPDVCLQCHGQLEAALEDSHSHRPFREEPCTVCHDAHAADQIALLKKAEVEICYDCHRESAFLRVVFPHSPVVKGNCVFCHDGHGEEHRFLLKREPAETCMRCHPDPEHIGDHPLVMRKPEGDGLSEADSPRDVTFPPSLNRYSDSDGTYSCIACHEAHGGDRAYFLRRPLDRGELCFECHSRRGVP